MPEVPPDGVWGNPPPPLPAPTRAPCVGWASPTVVGRSPWVGEDRAGPAIYSMSSISVRSALAPRD